MVSIFNKIQVQQVYLSEKLNSIVFLIWGKKLNLDECFPNKIYSPFEGVPTLVLEFESSKCIEYFLAINLLYTRKAGIID